MTGSRNVKGGLALLALSLVGGLVMSLWSFQPMTAPPPGFETYDALPRRLMRLAHVAAVMLPLLNIVLGPWIDRLRMSPCLRAVTSWMLLLGAVGLPAGLALEAFWPLARQLHPSGVPAVMFTSGVVFMAVAGARTRMADPQSR